MKKIKWLFDQYWFYVILGIVFSCLIQFVFYLVTIPKINFDINTVVELGTDYKTSSFSATYLGKDITDKVKITDNVDPTKVGNYDITYTISISGHKITKHRTVKVVDKIPPVLTLIGNTEAVICPGSAYAEEGYTAIDNYDGDISKNVTKTITESQIIYMAIDLSGNKVTAIRTITYKDIINPTISLKGNSKVYLYLGGSYKESGYTANDNCDGDITSKVVVSGTVNGGKLGSYIITYTVKDITGNSAKVTRTVAVITKPNNSGKTIYLTFDDGPGATTSTILDILKDEGVKATFFVIGRDNSYNYLIQRAYNEGHTIGLHCYSHYYQNIYTSETAYFNDLALISNKVKSITGFESKIIRFPGGSSNSISKNYSVGIMTRLAAEVTRRGYLYFDWNVGSTDTEQIGSDRVYSNVISRLSSGATSIVLMHDGAGNWQTANALRRIIDYGKEMGYSFSKITSATPQIHHKITN